MKIPRSSLKESSRRTVLTAAAAGIGVSPFLGGTATAHEPVQDSDCAFVALLAPENAVPEDGKYQPYSEEHARGMGVFTLVGDSVLEYEIMLANVEEMTGLHVHQGAPVENGPHLAELFNGQPTERINGVFLNHRLSTEDTCTSDPLGDNCLNEGFDPLLTSMHQGDAYLQAHIGNEVLRGQIHG